MYKNTKQIKKNKKKDLVRIRTYESSLAGLNNTIHLYSITAAERGAVVRHDKKYEPS